MTDRNGAALGNALILLSLVIGGSHLVCPLVGGAANAAESVSIGTRVEMFVDDWLLDESKPRTAALALHAPTRREVVFTTDKPWEGISSAYFTVLQDGPLYRLYYRGSIPGRDDSEQQVTCYAESRDGIRFTRPALGIHSFDGSKHNNIVLQGVHSHNFAPFLDGNPSVPPQERYKALAGIGGKLFGYVSPDGIRWKKIRAEPLLSKGTFDSLNLAFWDSHANCYRTYSRYFDAGDYRGFRSIQNCTSPDFIHWSEPKPNEYSPDAPKEHFYTSATFPCPGAPHHLLAFPMRFVPARKKVAAEKLTGVSDAVFMTSRDGEFWNRHFLEAWLRAGPDERNWTQRSNMPAWGIVQTDPDEFSMYVSEHYMWPDNRLRRLTIRRHGFGSMRADARGGEFTTRPVTFEGNQLVLNYATSAAGSVKVELQSADGQPLPGFSLADMDELYGDELDSVIRWKQGSNLSTVPQPVRFRFVMRDADLFSLRTVSSETAPTLSTSKTSK